MEAVEWSEMINARNIRQANGLRKLFNTFGRKAIDPRKKIQPTLYEKRENTVIWVKSGR